MEAVPAAGIEIIAPGGWEGPARLAAMLGVLDDRRFTALCEDLGVDRQVLEGDDLAGEKMSLVGMFVQRNALDELESAIKRAQSIQELQGSLPEPTTGTVVLFLSYSHRDDKFREALQKDLEALQAYVRAWYDGKIKGGDEIDPQIAHYLNEADVILLLVSPDFLRSSYVRERELPLAIQRHRAGEARVIPIILRPANWQEAPWDEMFGGLKAFPKDGKPISRWRSRDEAFVNIYAGLVEIIRELHQKTILKENGLAEPPS
jgi:TIR domain